MIPSRLVLRGYPTRNTTGTLLRAAITPIRPQPRGRKAHYSTVTEDAVPSSKKVWDSVDDAVSDVKSGDILLSGGKCS